MLFTSLVKWAELSVRWREVSQLRVAFVEVSGPVSRGTVTGKKYIRIVTGNRNIEMGVQRFPY